MSDERAEELAEFRSRAREASGRLEARAAEVLGLAKRIEDLTNGTLGWYSGMRSRLEAAETVRQVRVLLRALRALGDLDGSVRAGEGGEVPAPKYPS